MLVLEWKGGAFIEKVTSRCCCWFPAAILVDSFCPPTWRLHTKLYKGAWNVSATNSETVGHKGLRFGQIVYILVFYNISFSWLLPLDGFKCIFLYRVYCVTVKTKNTKWTFGLIHVLSIQILSKIIEKQSQTEILRTFKISTSMFSTIIHNHHFISTHCNYIIPS